MRKPSALVLVALIILAFALAIYGYMTWTSIGEQVTEEELSAAEVIGSSLRASNGDRIEQRGS